MRFFLQTQINLFDEVEPATAITPLKRKFVQQTEDEEEEDDEEEDDDNASGNDSEQESSDDDVGFLTQKGVFYVLILLFISFSY